MREVGGCNPGTTNEDLRRALLRFIADFANWDNAAQHTYLEVSRALMKAAHAPADGENYEPALTRHSCQDGHQLPHDMKFACSIPLDDYRPIAFPCGIGTQCDSLLSPAVFIGNLLA